jgi:hypothetical protein
MMDKNTRMTAMPDGIVTKLVEKKPAFKRDNGVAPEALPPAKKGGKGGNGKAGKVSRSPKRDKRDDKRDNKGDKENNLRKCFHCQQREYPTATCWNKQCGDPPKCADSAAKASTEGSATSTLTTSIENNWRVASSYALSSDWFIDCGCTTHTSACGSMFITYTKYSPNTHKLKGYNWITSFASASGKASALP